jgi:hypothetical protein
MKPPGSLNYEKHKNSRCSLRHRVSHAVPAGRLDIAHLGTNVVLFWSASAAGYGLQFETNLVRTNAWGNITNIPVIAGGTNYVTNPISGSAMFYRLAQ